MVARLRLIPLLLAAAALAACASTPPPHGTAAPDLVRALEGRWDSRVQAERGGEARQGLVIARIAAPALGPDVALVEWRDGGPDGPVTRRQVWAFGKESGGAPILEIFAAPGASIARTDLAPSEPRADGPACALVLTARGDGAFDAQSRRETCRAKAADGRETGAATRVTLMPTGLLYQEAAQYDDDTFAFKSPPGSPYEFRRP